MKTILLLTFLIFTTLHAQFLLIEVKDVNQIDLSKFSSKLKEEINNNEAVIILLPKMGDGIYQKTLSASNKNDIPELLTYIFRLKKLNVPVHTESFDEAEHEILNQVAKKYGPSFKYSIQTYADYNTSKKYYEYKPETQEKSPQRQIINTNDQYTIWDSFFSAGLWVAIGIGISILLFLYIRYLKRIKKLENYHKPISNNFKTNHLFNDEFEKKKSDFFDLKKNILNSLLILIIILSSYTIMQAQQLNSKSNVAKTSSLLTNIPEHNFYIDNTIIKPERSWVKNLLTKLISISPNSSFYLFGDSVRFLGKFNSNFSEYDTILSKITFKDRNTSFSALLKHTEQHSGVHLIITDGKPDFYGEDIPNVYHADSVKKIQNAKDTLIIKSTGITVNSLFNSLIHSIKNPFFQAGSLSSIIILIPIFFLYIRHRGKRPIVGPNSLNIVYRNLNGETKVLPAGKIRISGEKDTSSIFSDISFTSSESDLELHCVENKLEIKETQKLS